ncbi:MAG: glycosyltransferase family 2 protein, partial [Anaerolineae bacterium]|nr:glycosyltransferase family 2 protein [Anaerolineae bacterium]
VDSASSDGTPEAVAAAFPQVKLTASAENLGFGRSNNLAIRQIMSADEPPQAIYLLNPDTITQPGATRALFDALLAQPKTGLVGARLSYGDGSFQHGAFAFPGLLQLWFELVGRPGRFVDGELNGRYPRALYERGQPFPVDFVLGATMMLRREVVAQTGGFDEVFFMYCEEIDWAWRIHEAGWDVRCVPAAWVTHLAGQSTGQARPRSLVNLWTSRLLLVDKHYAVWKRPLARALIAVGMSVRMRGAADPALREAYQIIRRLALRGR